MRKQLCLLIVSCIVGRFLSAQSTETFTIRKYTHQHAGNIIQEFSDFLALPNVAASPANLQKNAIFIMDMMKKRCIEKVQLLSASTAEVAPAVYGEVMVPGATQTLIFYAHYDGQPVNPAQWAKGLDPFSASLLSAAIYKGGSKNTISG
jgi:acetylornithine deacetylase/succinyl-diaminopimelate desuccinylase-like protein